MDVITISCIAMLFFCLSILAALTDERSSGEYTLIVLAVITAPFWLPFALFIHICGILANEWNWKGEII